jgi:predicted ATPase
MTSSARARKSTPECGFVTHVELLSARVSSFEAYPFLLPAVAALRNGLALDPHATFFIGENGSGKSTLLEAIAIALGFNSEGGSANFRFSTRSSESELHRYLRIRRTEYRPRTGFFLRAESFFNVATNIEAMDREPAAAPPVIASYGGRSLHEQSHGESFLALVRNRFGPRGLYVLDEPEAALSPTRQLALLIRIHELAQAGSQFIIATHSPILMALPRARLYLLSERGIDEVNYRDTEHFQITKRFVESPESFIQHLLGGGLDPS